MVQRKQKTNKSWVANSILLCQNIIECNACNINIYSRIEAVMAHSLCTVATHSVEYILLPGENEDGNSNIEALIPYDAV